MHTAFEIRKEMFSFRRNGVPVDRDEVLDWGSQDRLGVLIDRPVGALGAGLLILAIITAFYDMPGRDRRRKPMYPEIFLFHVGGPWGLFLTFDFWPDHKEIMVPADAREVLRAINNRGITHLLLPDRGARTVVHRMKEPEAAIDRIKKCFVYSPDGTATGGDLAIATEHMRVLRNFAGVLDLDAYLASNASGDGIPRQLRMPPEKELRELETRLIAEHVRVRAGEVSRNDPGYVAAVRRLENARERGILSEVVRTVSPEDALSILA